MEKEELQQLNFNPVTDLIGQPALRRRYRRGPEVGQQIRLMVLPSRHQLIALIHPRQSKLLLMAAGVGWLMAPIRLLLLAAAG